jgi:hypothetical protein
MRLLGGIWPSTDDGTMVGNPATASVPALFFKNDLRDVVLFFATETPSLSYERVMAVVFAGGANFNRRAFFCAFNTSSVASSACS